MTVPIRFRAGRWAPWIVAALLALAALWLVARLRPLPPRTLVMATGPDGSAYAELAPRYRQFLARSGIELRLRPTAGAVENLALLRDPGSKVSVAFVQAGTTTAQDSPDLASLGTVFYEPFWLFYRGSSRSARLEDVVGKRLSVGPVGSGTRHLALRLLALDGIDERTAELFPFAPEQAGERLLRGEIDAAAILTSWDSPVVRKLLADPEIVLASFPRADAYVALNPYLSKLVLPTGVGDLARNLPPADVVLLGPKASLAVRRDLSPALQYLLLEAASDIHAGPGVFHKAGQFPAPETMDLPLSEDARQFYKSGRPWLQRNLPLWLAAFGERLLVLVIPLACLYPVLRFLPPLFLWSVRRRIFRLYGELKFLEKDLEERGAGQDTSDLVGRLEDLERRATWIRVPGFVAPSLYTLRVHVGLVRQRLEERARRVV